MTRIARIHSDWNYPAGIRVNSCSFVVKKTHSWRIDSPQGIRVNSCNSWLLKTHSSLKNTFEAPHPVGHYNYASTLRAKRTFGFLSESSKRSLLEGTKRTRMPRRFSGENSSSVAAPDEEIRA